MKKSITLLLLLAAIGATGQDTLFLKDGTTKICRYVTRYDEGLVVEYDNSQHYVDRMRIDSLHLQNKTESSRSILLAPKKGHKDLPEVNINDAGAMLQTGGTIGAVGAAVGLAGIALALVGALRNNNTLIYAGSGCAGIGFMVQLPAMLYIAKAGNRLGG